MALNNIYEFAQEATNILNNEDYEEDSSLLTGILAGSKARSELHNKIFKQATLCSAGLSQFVADNQDEDVDDSMTVEEYAEALTEAIDSRVADGIGEIVTQPQFDNQAVAATDEFVNRALGSYSYHRSISDTSTTLTAADVGAVITYNPSPVANGAWVLPDYTGFRLGSKIEVVNSINTTSILTLSPYSGQNMIFQSGVPFSTVVLGFGDNAQFVLVEIDSTLYWMLCGGTVSFRNSATFTYSKSTPGYYNLPGGVLYQWGTAPIPGGGSTDVSYPISFSTHAYCIQASAIAPGPPGGHRELYVYSLDASSFRVTSDPIESYPPSGFVYWFAIGPSNIS